MEKTNFVHRGICKLTKAKKKEWKALIGDFDYFINNEIIKKIQFRQIHRSMPKEVIEQLYVEIGDLIYKHLIIDKVVFKEIDSDSDDPPMTLVINDDSISMQ